MQTALENIHLGRAKAGAKSKSGTVRTLKLTLVTITEATTNTVAAPPATPNHLVNVTLRLTLSQLIYMPVALIKLIAKPKIVQINFVPIPAKLPK